MLTTRAGLTLYDTPQDAAALEAALLALINDAKHTIRMCMFSLTYRPIIDALIAAHVRGVDVQCMLDRSQATDTYDSAETARLVAGIGAANVCIGTTPNGEIVHIKTLSVDSTHWVSGSCNFTVSGPRETNAVVIASNAKLALDVEAVHAALVAWNTAHPYVPKPVPVATPAPSSKEPPGA